MRLPPQIEHFFAHDNFKITIIILLGLFAILFVVSLILLIILATFMLFMQNESITTGFNQTSIVVVYSSIAFLLTFILMLPAVAIDARRKLQSRDDGVNWRRDGF